MDYGQDVQLAKQFLREYSISEADGSSFPKYAPKLTEIANRESVLLNIELADVENFNHELTKKIIQNTNRYVSIFHEALDEILPFYKTKSSDDNMDPMDVFIEQRLKNHEKNQDSIRSSQTPSASNPSVNMPSNNRPLVDIEGEYPPELIRRSELSFKPPTLACIPIREVKAEKIGHLITIRGIVTRCTDVKPKIKIVTYTCDQCGCESFQPVNGCDYTPLFECTSAACKSNKALGRIFMQTRGSKFIKYQEIKLQEHSDQVPTGHIPRAITVMAHGEMTRLCAPGDHISVSGVFLTLEKSGFMRKTGGLAADTYIDAHYICQMNKTEDDELNDDAMTFEEASSLLSGNNFLGKLSSSIAPEIYGHENLKKALLLLLVGGVDQSPYGMKIRGNINICLMGDPGVAKSQLLGFIDRLAVRSQYTTGRGSSGVGLTAAVLRDPVTNELVLEGGALVLADQGICCIDEFDKMMEADRTAIHEVMEQQTVSIAKAGIMTTLNARVSILAAANPAYGRYNVHRSITDNLQLPPALLSRFDLLWLIKDIPDTQRDLNLASHVTQIHRNELPEQEYEALDMKVMRRYLALCRTKNPIVPEYLTEKFVAIYLNVRSKKRSSSIEDALFTSPRSLLAILRLTTAFARLRLSDVVEEADLEAAVFLYNCSRDSIEGAVGVATSVNEKISNIIKKISRKSESSTVSIESVLHEAAEMGFSEDQVRIALDTLAQYEAIFYDEENITVV